MSANKKIMIINYGMGNIRSIANALEILGGEYLISDKYEDMDQACALILPGVGAFGMAMENLKKFNLINELKRQVLENKKPFFGICLGMQLLAEDSTEMGFSKGLGWVKGHVVKLESEGKLHVPHVGWNNVHVENNIALFDRVDEGANFYFDHSYHLDCDPDWIAATFEYGGKYVAAIAKDNIWATQFHPEKSQRNGLKMLRNFINGLKTQDTNQMERVC